jgi:hypothetical protein
VDSEDEDHAEITVTQPLLDRYQQTVRAFVDGAGQYCRRRGITHLMTSTQVPVEQMVTRYLRQRGLVR